MKRYRLLTLALLIGCMPLLSVVPAQAQTPQVITAFDVFIDPATTTLYFVNAATGLSKIVATSGTNYTLLDKGVLFQERTTGIARIVYPDGHLEVAAWMEPAAGNVTVIWVISADRKRIAWAVSPHQGPALYSDLYTALTDGTGKKLVLHTSSTQGIESIPLTLSNDGTTLFYTRQPADAPNTYQLFPVAANIFGLDVASGTATELPGEPKCACASAFTTDGRFFARLEPEGSQQGFKLHFWNISKQTETLIAAPPLLHAQAGYLILSVDGTLAAYLSAHGTPPTKAQPERFVLVLVNIGQHQQRTLTDPIPDKLRPVAFTTNNRALILIDAEKGGTYKLSLSDNTLLLVSAYRFLGRLSSVG